MERPGVLAGPAMAGGGVGGGGPLARKHCTTAFHLPSLPVGKSSLEPFAPLTLAKLERGRNTVCFHITCWVSPTLVSEEMDRTSLVLGRFGEEGSHPYPIQHMLT